MIAAAALASAAIRRNLIGRSCDWTVETTGGRTMQRRVGLAALVTITVLSACAGAAGSTAPREPSPPVPAASPGPTPAATSSAATAPPDAAPHVTVPDDSIDAPEAVAARAFVDAVDERDFAAAWELLGPRSQDALGSQAALEEMRSALAEGWGAWAYAPDAVIFRSGVLATAGEGRLSIVTFTGTVTQEGSTERRTVAAPAWVAGDGDDPDAGRFEPFAQGDVPLVIDDPVEAGTVPCDGIAVAAEGPMEHDGAVASLDGDASFTPDFDTDLAEPGRIVFPLDAALSAGEHVLTFGMVTGAGTPIVDAVRFTVEGPC